MLIQKESEGEFVWPPEAVTKTIEKLVVFQNGAVFKRKDMKTAEKVPVPPGFAKLFRVR